MGFDQYHEPAIGTAFLLAGMVVASGTITMPWMA